MLLPVVTLKTARNSRHPWIFHKMVQPLRSLDLPPGSLVTVKDRNGASIGTAFYHPTNTIALRLLTENPGETVDGHFFHSRLTYAKELREGILGLPGDGDCYRLVHAEADFMPGLVIDKFADLLVVEPYVAGWIHVMDLLVDSLMRLFPGHRVAVRPDSHAAEKEGVSFDAVIKRYPAPGSVDIRENGLTYRVDLRTGHKTGFFLDQRENRALVSTLAAGRSVLDLCCYTGGFSVSAAKGGADHVSAVDLDEKALAAAGTNAELNGYRENIRFRHGDAFEILREFCTKEILWDVVILDPPKLAGGQDDVEKALRRYLDLNQAAVRVVRPGGLLFTCSCSGAVPEERWRQTVRKAAGAASRGLTMLAATGAGPDHPVAGDFPQGRYLKTILARVD